MVINKPIHNQLIADASNDNYETNLVPILGTAKHILIIMRTDYTLTTLSSIINCHLREVQDFNQSATVSVQKKQYKNGESKKNYESSRMKINQQNKHNKLI